MAYSNQAIRFSRYRPERIACSIQILEPSHDHRSPLLSLFSYRSFALFLLVLDPIHAVLCLLSSPARATLSSAPSASPASLLPWLPSAFRAAPAPNDPPPPPPEP